MDRCLHILIAFAFQLLQDAKDWQEKHEKLSEQIKAYHKTQTELENALAHKENEIEVSSVLYASNVAQRFFHLFTVFYGKID